MADTPTDSSADASSDVPVKIAERGDWTVLRITEPSLMDVAVIEQLNEQVEAQLSAGRRKLVLDFKHVQYISSSMVGVLVATNQSVKKAKGQLILCALNERLLELLKLTRLDKMFKVEPDARSALKSVGAVQ